MIVLLIFGCAGIGKGWYWAKDGFHFLRLQVGQRGEMAKLRLDEMLGEEATEALGQEYRYLGRGKQCYAFESQDGRYILKLPRMDRYGLPLWLKVCNQMSEGLFSGYKKALEADHPARKAFLFESFRLSLSDLQEETALLALHLEPTLPTGKEVLLKNRLRFSYRLPLDKTLFALQRKKALLVPTLQEALRRGDVNEAHRIVEAWVVLVGKRAHKGILNKDASFLRNFGYEAGRAFQIDIGSFYKGKSERREVALRSIRETMEPVRAWMAKQDLALLKFCEEVIAREQSSL